MTAARPLLVSNDTDLIDDLLRLAAAAGVELNLAGDAEAARGRWSVAPLVLVGCDAAAEVAGSRPARRRDVIVVAKTPSPEDWQRAVLLGAEHVVSLPDAERWLIDRLADGAEGSRRNGVVVAVVSAGAGAGGSTLAVTMALAAAARSMRVLLVDADPLGGGLDLLMGMEDITGARWADLIETRGRVSPASLDHALPHAAGVTVLSWGRDGERAVPADSMTSVLEAGERGFDLVVIDLPRLWDVAGEVAVARCHEALIVATNHVRSSAGALRLSQLLRSQCSSVRLVVRSDPKGLDEETVASALDMPVLGRLPTVNSLVARADAGELPSVRDGYGRAVQRLLAAVVDLGERVA